jgi:uncharacterized protein YecT (DUF1311 family)
MILALALALLAAQPSPSDQWNCEAPQTQLELNQCAGIDFRIADEELNQEYRRAIAWARDDDREERVAGDDRPGDEATLREAQRAWVAFRDAQCRLEGYAARGGSMETMFYNGCRARLTRARTAQVIATRRAENR